MYLQTLEIFGPAGVVTSLRALFPRKYLEARNRRRYLISDRISRNLRQRQPGPLREGTGSEEPHVPRRGYMNEAAYALAFDYIGHVHGLCILYECIHAPCIGNCNMSMSTSQP